MTTVTTTCNALQQDQSALPMQSNELAALTAALQITARAEERLQEQEAHVAEAVERWASVVDSGVQQLFAKIAEMHRRLDASEQVAERAIRKSNAEEIKEIAVQVLAVKAELEQLTTATDANRAQIAKLCK